MTNDELTDATRSTSASPGRSCAGHGRDEGERRIVDGTRRNSTALGVPERFDEALSERWVRAVANAIADGPETFEDFLDAHPDLARSGLLGKPAWTRAR
ncbi:MAG: hypothetical protein ACRDNE_08640 [Gaiellaceae bacterium]